MASVFYLANVSTWKGRIYLLPPLLDSLPGDVRISTVASVPQPHPAPTLSLVNNRLYYIGLSSTQLSLVMSALP